MIPVMASHGEGGLTGQGYPAVRVPPVCRVLPHVLRVDLPVVTVVARHCNSGLTLLRQADSTLYETNPKRGIPACLPPDLGCFTGGPRYRICP